MQDCQWVFLRWKPSVSLTVLISAMASPKTSWPTDCCLRQSTCELKPGFVWTQTNTHTHTRTHTHTHTHFYFFQTTKNRVRDPSLHDKENMSVRQSGSQTGNTEHNRQPYQHPHGIKACDTAKPCFEEGYSCSNTDTLRKCISEKKLLAHYCLWQITSDLENRLSPGKTHFSTTITHVPGRGVGITS